MVPKIAPMMRTARSTTASLTEAKNFPTGWRTHAGRADEDVWAMRRSTVSARRMLGSRGIAVDVRDSKQKKCRASVSDAAWLDRRLTETAYNFARTALRCS